MGPNSGFFRFAQAPPDASRGGALDEHIFRLSAMGADPNNPQQLDHMMRYLKGLKSHVVKAELDGSFYQPLTNTIYLSEDDAGPNTVYHEGAHAEQRNQQGLLGVIWKRLTEDVPTIWREGSYDALYDTPGNNEYRAKQRAGELFWEGLGFPPQTK